MGQSNSRGVQSSSSLHRRRSGLPAVTVTPPTPSTSPTPLSPTAAAVTEKERRRSTSYTSSFRRRKDSKKKSSKASSSSLGVPPPPPVPQPELPSGSSSSSSSSSSAAVASSSSSSSRHRTQSTPNYGASSSSTSTSSHPSTSGHRHSADMGLGINHGALSLAAPPTDATPPKRSSFRKSIMNLVRPTSLFETKAESGEADRTRTQSLTRTAIEKPVIAPPPVLVEEPHPIPSNSNNAQEPNGADGIEEVPRLTTTALAPNPTEKGKSKQPASDVPQDAISIASGSVSDEPSTAARHIHHTPSQSDERQELQAPVIGGAADSESTPAVAYREGSTDAEEEANNLGACAGQTSHRTILGREGEHAVTSWLEEELQRVEESSSSSAALGGSDQTIPEPPLSSSSSSSAAPMVASASASGVGLDGLPALEPISNPSPENLSPIPSSPTPAARATPAASPSNTPASPSTGTGTPRHFPPPGTLVVVQGIVHTSDAPPAASSSPSTSTSDGPSPSSSPQSRPSTARADSGSTASSASNRNETSTGQTTPDHVVAGEGDEAQRPVPPAISNGSIDVLGTLLSVAASATAASLLTGNAPTWNATPLDPSRGPQSFPSPTAAANALRASPSPFRSGAQPNSPSPNSNPFSNLTSNPGNARNRHMHHPRPPTPSPAGGEGGQEGGHVGRADRLRMAWGTIRERLGLGSGSTRSANGSGDTTPTGNGNAAPLPSILNPSTTTPWAPNTHTASPNTRLGSPNTTDAGSSPRDVMLAEMARAFNIGLGLDANPSGNSGLIQSSVNAAGGVMPVPAAATTSPSSPASASTVPAPSLLNGAASTSTVTPETANQRDANGNPLPSPGSFDRFLHDIQADLRLALTPPNEEEVERGEREERERAERERVERERVERERLEVLERVERQRVEVLERLDRLRRGETEWRESQRVAAERERRDREQGRDDDGVVDPTVQQLREYQERHRQRELLEQQQQHDSEDEEEFGDMPALAEISDESEDEDSVVGDEQPARLTIDTATAALPTLTTSATLPALDTSATVPPLETSATSPAPATATTPTRAPLSLAELSVPSTTGSGTTALGSGRIDVTGRINWWRMYRFPAVTSVPGAVGARSPPTSPSSPAANSSSFPTATPSSAAHPAAAPPPVIPGGVSATAPTGTLLPNFPAPAAGQPVVPVIVVGLQSVNSAWQQEELANIAAAAGGPEAASAIRRSSIAGSPTLASPASGGVLGGGAGRGVPASPSPPPLSPIQRPQSPTSPVSPTNTTSTSSSGRRRRERRVWTQEEIEASPFGWPPMDWDEDESDEEDEDDEEAEEEQAQRRIDEQQRRREERSAYRSSRATTGSLDLPPLLDSPSSPSDATPASPDTNTANTNNTAGAGGARTFLIYVVGGYYPPDHTIVTGGLDNFESFEALLELAEMLGHAKPPTVTKEDIDKSGLETIKPSQLSQYEDEGRVSYNCIERCLICLDDYEEEDDIRIMSCRHAFHKDCVDKWLQTGKNNCPACRSTGVNSS